MELLRDLAGGTKEFDFVPAPGRSRAAASLERGIKCLLATQIVVHGRRTVWCQQYDPLTLQPASARNYEMPSACSAESEKILMFLMALPHHSAHIVSAVHGAAEWFQKTQIRGVAYKFDRGEGRHLVSAPGNGPLWARFYEIGTDRPIFGDRDKTIHDTVDEIS